MTSKARALVAMFGALVYALAGLRVLWFALPSVAIAVRDYAAASGGIGAVSAGVDVVFEAYALLVVAGIIVNVMLRAWVKRADATAKAIHRTQRWSIVLAFVVMIAGAAGFTSAGGALPLMMVPLSGVAWGLNFLLTAALLGVYAVRPNP